ncbi:MAG: glycosyltransferase family 2 protein, partial [bacterium]
AMPSNPELAASVSVIVPAFNEAATIAAIVHGCRDVLPPPAELLVVDDGSTDATAAAAEAAGARVIRLTPNRGKGNALRIGIEQSVGEILVFLDADGQDDPHEIPLLLAALARGADLVVGSRFLGHFDAGAITPINRVGNQAITGVVNLLFGVKLTDTQAGFRAVRRSLIERLTLAAQHYDIETDLLLQAMRVGGRAVEVPVRRAARQHGASGLNPIIDGLRILSRILRVRFQPAIGRAQ